MRPTREAVSASKAGNYAGMGGLPGIFEFAHFEYHKVAGNRRARGNGAGRQFSACFQAAPAKELARIHRG